MAGLKTIWNTQLTDVKATDVEGVGRIRIDDTGNMYRWVKNTTTNWTPTAGTLACHAFTDGNSTTVGLELTTIYQPATATLGLLAGVVMAAMSASTGTNPLIYGWIQILGHNASVSVTPVNTQTTANPVAGNALIAANAVGYAATGQAMGTAPSYTRKLLLLDSVAGSTTVQTCNVLVQCL
jgi:hypothetical protein